MDQKPMRILHVLGTLNRGGAESRIMDLYRNMDRTKVQFDFLIHTKEICHFEEDVGNMGGRIFRVPRFRLYNYFKYCKSLKSLFSIHNDFRAVHGHMTSTASIYLPIAKKKGIPLTIAHARSAGVDKGIKGIITKLIRYRLQYKTDFCFACATIAGEAVFGKKAVMQNKVIIWPNTIMADKFRFNDLIRKKMRTELGINEKFVIGHVGRFHPLKNHEFLLDVFKDLCSIKTNCYLLLLGDGELRQKCEKKVKQLGIGDKVLFLGNQSDPENYYQAMDFLLFPSIYEGMPGTVIEAQASGLPCLVSDTVTQEVKYSNLVTFKSLKDSKEEWAKFIANANISLERDRYEETVNAGFDVKDQAKKLTKFYETMQIN